jgi:hypothetical protein
MWWLPSIGKEICIKKQQEAMGLQALLQNYKQCASKAAACFVWATMCFTVVPP